MRERRYLTDPLPSSEDVERFAPPYSPEPFTQEETRYLQPFFSNIDKPVFVIQHLPEEVIGALSSRYSRTTDSLRRVFLREYIKPVVWPESQPNWPELTPQQQDQALMVRDKFIQLISFLETHGGIDYVVNIQRGRKFFDVWLEQYGDDSIAELGGVHLAIEGLSNVAVKEIEDKRIGISPLEKSTRYVTFADKRADGEYLYIVPGELLHTEYEVIFRNAADSLFVTYSQLLEPYLDYIKERYPQGEDETVRSFNNSRGAKRFDDLRDLLPFATQTNVALFGNGRAFEDLINRLMDHPLGELRYWGQAICRELESVVPSFVKRPKTTRGAEMQIYRTNLKILREELSQQILEGGVEEDRESWARLISYTPAADVEVVSAFLFSGNHRYSFARIREKVLGMSPEQRAAILARVIKERSFGKDAPRREEVRFRKVPRAFENAHYLFEVWARGGDYRDLHRHRQLTQERQRFTTTWGYDLEDEVLNSPFTGNITAALGHAKQTSEVLASISPDIAQYLVPFAFIQHWYMNLSAREIFWIGELRTGSQARPHYKEVALEIVDSALRATPAVFQGIMVDRVDYRLARRDSEKRIEKKLKQLK